MGLQYEKKLWVSDIRIVVRQHGYVLGDTLRVKQL